MPDLREQTSGLANWYNDRPIRERGIILVTLLVLVFYLGWELAVASTLKQLDSAQSELQQLQERRQVLSEQQTSLQEMLSSDHSAGIRRQLSSRRERLGELERRISDATDRLVSPTAMVSLLRDMLETSKRLELQGVTLKTPVPVYNEDAGPGESQGQDNSNRTPLMYAHEVEVVIEGGYLDLLAYLERLEQMDQRLGWVSLKYDVAEFPKGIATLTVRTLSLERSWLGV